MGSDITLETWSETGKQIDPGRFRRLATYHQIEPIAYFGLKNAPPCSVLEGLAQGFEKQVHTTQARNLFLINELDRLLRTLEKSGVKALPLKGPVLTAALYGTLTRRWSVDLDILIPRPALKSTVSTLLDEGYIPQNSRSAAPWKGLENYRSCQYQYARGQNTFNIDVHTRIMPRRFAYNPSFDNLSSRAEPLTIAGKTVHQLAPVDRLFLLCNHGLKNRWERLKQISDVAAFLQCHPQFDWEDALQRASQLHSRRALCFGLYIVNVVLGTRIPEPVGRALPSRNRLEAVMDPVIRHLSNPFTKNGMDIAKRLLFHTFAQDTVSGTLRYVAFALGRRALSLGS